MSHFLLSIATATAVSALGAPALAQANASPHTTGIRYDAERRVTGTIAPDPDGTGPLGHPAVRNTYDASGRLVTVETGVLQGWQSGDIAPAAWAGFTVDRRTDSLFDAGGRKIKESISVAGVTYAVTQMSYDAMGRLECTAVRMNPAAFGALPASACVLGPQGSHGRDRITRMTYHGTGWVHKVQKAYGTSLQQDYATYTYSVSGKVASLTDANGATASYDHDGHDRLKRWYLPSKTTAGVSSPTDFEEYGYDANGNRTSLRKRDGSVITYQYDALNRNTVKIVPERSGLNATYTRDVYYGYDLRGLQTYARFDSGAAASEGVTTTYDGFGRMTSSALKMDGVTRTLAYAHDKNGNRTRVTYPDLVFFDTSYDGLDREKNLVEYDLTVLRTTNYDDHGRVSSDTLFATPLSQYGYDPVGRLNALSHDATGSAQDVVFTYGYTPASQMAQRTRDNDAYAWTGHVNVNRNYTVNGLNQYTTAGSASFAYDANGNLTSDGSTTYVYDIENRLVSASGATNATLRYDPLGRLYEVGGAGLGVTKLLYDGDELVAEYDGVDNLLRRYVHGRGVDDPVVWYESGPGWPNGFRRLLRDHQGSIIGVLDGTGAAIAINAYDEYGIPKAGNLGRFQYTGQAWIPELGMYHYKARIYSPTLGRFLQTDPIGYDDQVNLYAYVGNDPVNKTDPSGNEGVVDDVVDWGKMVVSDLGDLANGIAHGEFEWAFGGMPPQLGGGVVSESMAVARAATALRAEATAARAAPAATRGGENAAAAAGRQAHRELAERVAQKPGWKSEPRMTGADGKTYKPDVVTPRGRIMELKPDTASGRAAGARQTSNYSNQLGAPARTITYQPPAPPPPPKPWWKF